MATAAHGAAPQDERISAELRTQLQRSISVRLGTEKAVYDAAEAPMLTMEVVNMARRPVYMYSKARLGDAAGGS